MATSRAWPDRVGTLFRLPESPERHPDEDGGPINPKVHFGNTETMLVKADRWIITASGARPMLIPDLMIAFEADTLLYQYQRGCVISDQGKPPDFVLEVASPSTARRDTGDKRIECARMGIPEYWRFDSTGQNHGDKLAGEGRVDQLEAELRRLREERNG